MVKPEKIGVVIKKGKEIIEEFKRNYKNEQKNYNLLLKENQNLFYRPTYVKRGKKIYYYWYRYEWDPVKKRTIHKYIGKIKPNEENPDLPINPLEKLKFNEITGTKDIILPIEEYEKFKRYFKNKEIYYLVKNSY